VKLSELRKQLRTGELQAALAEQPSAGPSLRQYRLNKDGTDALILFGKHKGLRISQITKKDPSYLNWILEEEFTKELKEVVRYVLKARDGRALADLADEMEKLKDD
jgi:hypothetical protein